MDAVADDAVTAANDDVVVGDVGDVVAVVGVGDGVNPMRNGTRKSHKKFQLSKLRIVDRRSRLVEGSEIVGGGGGGGSQVNIVSVASLHTRT